jgi:hypothetical protein
LTGRAQHPDGDSSVAVQEARAECLERVVLLRPFRRSPGMGQMRDGDDVDS